MHEDLQKIYSCCGGQVRPSSITERSAAIIYQDYVEFIESFCHSGRLLDVGCGAGWSTYIFSNRGFQATGLDLNATAFEPKPGARLDFSVGDAMGLPFQDESFEVVAAYQCLEHVPVPEQALADMLQVLRPGGVLCIVGPNLLSLGLIAKALFIHVWRNRPAARIFFRDSSMPRHPFGNTIFEVCGALPVTVGRIIKKKLTPTAGFTMRDPDLTPPFHSDNDACYLCNPIDLAKYLRRKQCAILKDGKPGRLPFTSILAGGTWVSAKKGLTRRKERAADADL